MTNPNGPNIVQWSGFSPEAFAADEERIDALSQGDYVKLVNGENVLRFLPLPPGATRTSPFRITRTHYLDIPGLPRKVVFDCSEAEDIGPCGACAYARKLASTGSPVDRKESEGYIANLSIRAVVLPRASEAQGVKILKYGVTISKGLAALRRNTRIGGDFTDPSAAGFDTVISRSGGEKNNDKINYAVARDAAGARPLVDDPAWAQELIDTQPDLNALVDCTVPAEFTNYVAQLGRAAAARGPGMVRGASVASTAFGAPRQPAALPAGQGVGSTLMARGGRPQAVPQAVPQAAPQVVATRPVATATPTAFTAPGLDDDFDAPMGGPADEDIPF